LGLTPWRARAFLREALQTLEVSSVHVGAQLRTAFVLAGVLEANSIVEEAQQLRRDTMLQLENVMGKGLEGMDVNEAFFDQFVLFCHR
jgi:hypothetical protein